MTVPEDFTHQVSNALNHLYDPDVLRDHPLIAVFGLERRSSPHAALRDILITEIERLKPDSSIPIEGRLWRVYKLLQLRYINQMDQDQTAFQLGIGVRHLRREQKAAVVVLADALYQKFNVQKVTTGSTSEMVLSLESEISKLKTEEMDNSAILGDILPSTLVLLSPFAEKRGIKLELLPLPDLPPVALLSAALRQSIVSMTTCAIGRLSEGKLVLTGRQENNQVKLELVAETPHHLLPASDSFAAGINTVRTILGGSGQLLTSEGANSLCITLVLQVVDIVRLLIIDDNSDVAQLFQRYLFGTQYKIEAVKHADELFETIAQKPADVILLDVMMPGKDGWEILGRLKNHPLTNAIPVVICTVLPEKDLALALGASDYLAKPASRESLQMVLNRVLSGQR